MGKLKEHSPQMILDLPHIPALSSIVFVQVQILRAAATAKFNSILAQIDSGGNLSPGGTTSESATGADLQQRLEAAITALQEGLVERDTEASDWLPEPLLNHLAPCSVDVKSTLIETCINVTSHSRPACTR